MASPASSANSASGSGSKKEERIGDLMLRLGIEDDEFDDVVFEEDETAPKQGMKWLALVKVHTANSFSPITFENHMRNAWSPAQRIEFHHLENNLFMVQCFCLGDWIKIKEGGPWLFRQNAVCIEEYDGLMSTDHIDLNFFEAWIQIYKLPIGYHNEALIKNLTRKIGQVTKIETNVMGMGNFIRIRVKLDVRKVVARFVSMVRDGVREIYHLQYEKIPKFCGACGFFGHSHLECGSGEHDEAKLKWGDFLMAEWDTWHGRGPSFARGSGRGGGRPGRSGEAPFGRGHEQRGRGGLMTSWRHNAIIPGTRGGDPDLNDTATSPGKVNGMDMDKTNLTNPLAKRALDLDGKEVMGEKTSNVLVDNSMEGIVTNDGATIDENLNALADKDRKKRTKKDGADSPSFGSAGSREEPVRSQ
jgi:hypothetical protein